MPTLGRITIYPLKSFDPIELQQAEILPNGALRSDRQFAFADTSGYFFNAKRTADIHQLEVHLDPAERTLSARRRSDQNCHEWHIDSQRSAVEQWFSEFFSKDVTLFENTSGGFPDDDDAPGPTVLSQATLQSVAGWFPGLSLQETRLRFRANLEIDGVEPFWEDHLYGPTAGVVRPFRVGDVLFGGTNPCQRCVVPTRNPSTGEIWHEFAKQFATLREMQLPQWAAHSRFNHYYRLSVNTRLIDRNGGVIQVGDSIDLVGPEQMVNMPGWRPDVGTL